MRFLPNYSFQYFQHAQILQYKKKKYESKNFSIHYPSPLLDP